MMLEQLLETQESKAKIYSNTYEKQLVMLENLPIAKVKGGVKAEDIVNLGERLDMWKKFYAIHEKQGTVNSLGIYPKVALDVITTSYGTDPCSLFASIQNIPNQSGIVWFLDTIANTTKGNMEIGDIMTSAQNGKIKTGDGYAEDYGSAFEVSITASATAQTFELPYTTRLGSIKVSLKNTPDTFGVDNGKGKIIGAGVWGTVDYDAKVVELTFATAPQTSDKILVDFLINYEQEEDIPSTQYEFQSTEIKAHTYALKQTTGLFQNFDFQMARGGGDLESMVIDTLVGELNSEKAGRLIREMIKTLGADTDDKKWTKWNYYPENSAEPYVFHRDTFKYSISQAEGKLRQKAGRGMVNAIVAGVSWCTVMQDDKDYVKILDATTIGTYLVGTWRGMPVVCCNDPSIIDKDTAILLYKNPNDNYDAAAVVATYMDMVILNNRPNGLNPLLNQQAVASWVATKVVVPNLIQGHKITYNASTK